HLLLDLAVAAKLRVDHARPDEDRDPVAPGPAREPARSDAGAVPGQLGDGAVGVPDHDLGGVTVDGDDLEDAIRPDAEVVVADLLDPLTRQRNVELRPLREQVVVAETVPFRESHPPVRPGCAPRSG